MQDGERMDDQLRELVALGKEHFQRGDYSLAAGHLEHAVARGVGFADVHHMLGVIYHQLGEFEAAQRALQKALEINPGYIEAGLNLAIVCNDLGQYERAQQIYGAALERARARGTREPNGDEPMDSSSRGKIANLHASVADGYLSMRRPNDAAAEYRRALSLCPTFVICACGSRMPCAKPTTSKGRWPSSASPSSTRRLTCLPGWHWAPPSMRAGSWKRPKRNGRKCCAWSRSIAPRTCA